MISVNISTHMRRQIPHAAHLHPMISVNISTHMRRQIPHPARLRPMIGVNISTHIRRQIPQEGCTHNEHNPARYAETG